MTNSNKKTYSTFAEHPLAPVYFQYIDILVNRDLNEDVQYLIDIAHASLTDENLEIIIDKVVTLMKVAQDDDSNEFEELRKKLENPS